MNKKSFLLGILFVLACILPAGCGRNVPPGEDTVQSAQSPERKGSGQDRGDADAQETVKMEEIGKTEEVGEVEDVRKAGQTDETEGDGPEDETTMGEIEGGRGREGIVLEEANRRITECILPQTEAGAVVSVYYQDLGTDNYASVGAQQMQAASLIKLFIAGCAYEQKQIQDAAGNGTEIEEMVRPMITASDNDAANQLVLWIGGGDAAAGRAAVNQYCAGHGYHSTHMGRMLLEPNTADDNYTSAEDCGKFLRDIYRSGLAGSVQIMEYMRQQQRTNKIPAGIPAETAVANKTGELADVENDAAIVFSGSGGYILCVLMEALSDTAAARECIVNLSAQMYQMNSSGD